MAGPQLALVRDLISTGYFTEDLKRYSKSQEIDLPSFSKEFAVPYLTRTSKSYRESGELDRSMILNLAIKYLTGVSDDELVDSIFGLKKIAASEIDTNEKALHQSDYLNKSELRSCRRKSESAMFLSKMLVSIIRMFKLVEVNTRHDKAEENRNFVYYTIRDCWKLAVVRSV